MDSELILTELTDFSIDLLLAAGAFILGYLVVRYVIVRLLRQFLQRSGLDPVFVSFATTIANILLIQFVVIISLDILGVNTGILLALLAGVLLAVVSALQGWLRDVAAGLWMFVNKPFKLDDLVMINGVEGRVQKIHILTTTLRTDDNLVLTIPNHTIASKIITNYHDRAERRIELEILIRYEDDIRKAIAILHDTIMADERVLKEPEPIIAVADLGENGIILDVKPWVKQEDFEATRYALREKIKYALDANHLIIPYPQLTLHTDREIP